MAEQGYNFIGMLDKSLLQIEDQPARVLYVGGEPDGKDRSRVHLARVGYDVIAAKTGANYAGLVASDQPDVAVIFPPSDANLTPESIRELKCAHSARDLLLIVVAGNANSAFRTGLYDAGADCVLAAPVDPPELVAVIRTHLRSRRLCHTLVESSQEMQAAYSSAKDAVARYQSLFNDSFDAMFVVDAASGAVRDSNQAAFELTGISRPELEGRSFWELCPAAPRSRDAGVLQTEFVCRGVPVPVLIKVNSVHSMAGSLLQYSVRDLTPLHDVRHERLGAERLSAVIETAVTINEELNTPLTVIVTSAEALRRSLRGVDSKVFTRLDYILEAAQQAQTVIDMLTKVRRAASKEYLNGTQMLDLEASLAEVEKGTSNP
ncbi:MAG: PAS domain S-box protein [Capsulimonadaceae bacterium]|nr:PAS domain S-box protein [Capsulimonadaceae bacterium]